MSTKKIGFTTARIGTLHCVAGKSQSIYWDSKAPGLGVRITPSGNKAFIFQTWFNDTNLRLTIGDVGTWSESEGLFRQAAESKEDFCNRIYRTTKKQFLWFD